MAALGAGCRRYATSSDSADTGDEISILRRACGVWAAVWSDGSVRLVLLGQGNARRTFTEPADGIQYRRPAGEPDLDEVEPLVVELENRHRNDPGGVDFEMAQADLVTVLRLVAGAAGPLVGAQGG